VAAVSLPHLEFLTKDDSTEVERDRHKAAGRICELRTIKTGLAAWESIRRAETFDQWVRIARALLVGRQIALRESGAPRPMGTRYVRAFHNWVDGTSFATMHKVLRAHTLAFAENLEAIEAWRSTISDAQRKRLIGPQANLTRWRAAMACPDARAPADWRREAKVAAKRLIVCLRHLPRDQARTIWQGIQAEGALYLG
jgi:hypothetical protein